MDQVGPLNQLYQTYKELAEFRLIYIAEAHAADSGLATKFAIEYGITQHTSKAERCERADQMVQSQELAIPTLVDNMDNSVAELYSAFPTRFCLIDLEGRIAITTEYGPRDMSKAVPQAQQWLEYFEEYGRGPATGLQ